MQNPQIIPMSSITDELIKAMHLRGITNVRVSTLTHVRRNIEREFGDSIQIITDENDRLLLVSSSLTVSMLASENYRLRQRTGNASEEVDICQQHHR